MQRRDILKLAGALGAAGSSTLTWAQQGAYPNRPIELVVSFGAGGGTDVLARALSEGLRTHLPQPVTVNNKPGASGSIGMTDVARSAPDGYKLIMLTVEATILSHIGIGKVNNQDFTPIARLNFDPSAITVRADAPWNTLEEFMDAARKKPGEISVATLAPVRSGMWPPLRSKPRPASRSTTSAFRVLAQPCWRWPAAMWTRWL